MPPTGHIRPCAPSELLSPKLSAGMRAATGGQHKLRSTYTSTLLSVAEHDGPVEGVHPRFDFLRAPQAERTDPQEGCKPMGAAAAPGGARSQGGLLRPWTPEVIAIVAAR